MLNGSGIVPALPDDHLGKAKWRCVMPKAQLDWSVLLNSCEAGRRRRLKCDKILPNREYCVETGTECSYTSATRPHSPSQDIVGYRNREAGEDTSRCSPFSHQAWLMLMPPRNNAQEQMGKDPLYLVSRRHSSRVSACELRRLPSKEKPGEQGPDASAAE